MLTIKVIGSSCSECNEVEVILGQVVETMGIQAEVIEITDLNQITSYNLLATPGLVINDKLVCSGRVPNQEEITTWLEGALAAG